MCDKCGPKNVVMEPICDNPLLNCLANSACGLFWFLACCGGGCFLGECPSQNDKKGEEKGWWEGGSPVKPEVSESASSNTATAHIDVNHKLKQGNSAEVPHKRLSPVDLGMSKDPEPRHSMSD